MKACPFFILAKRGLLADFPSRKNDSIVSLGGFAAPDLHHKSRLTLHHYVEIGITGCNRKYVNATVGYMAKSSEIIVREILEFMQLEGGHAKMWCVGVTDDAQEKLFDEHQVHYQNDAWIYRTASSEIEAQRVEEYFREYGLDGGRGVKHLGSRMVYAYRKSINTEP
jgi:hypothetical protein